MRARRGALAPLAPFSCPVSGYFPRLSQPLARAYQRLPFALGGDGTDRQLAGEPRDSQKFFGSFFQKRTEARFFFLKKEAKTFVCWARRTAGATRQNWKFRGKIV
jgi:hypothetical protein